MSHIHPRLLDRPLQAARCDQQILMEQPVEASLRRPAGSQQVRCSTCAVPASRSRRSSRKSWEASMPRAALSCCYQRTTCYKRDP